MYGVRKKNVTVYDFYSNESTTEQRKDLRKELKMKYKKLYIGGMTCSNCQRKIEKILMKNPSVKNISVSYEKETAEFEYDPRQISLTQIIKTIEDQGYDVLDEKNSNNKKMIQAFRECVIILALFGGLQYTGLLNRLVPGSLAEEKMGYGMLFATGVITSVHCIAMCGGINLSQTLTKEENGRISRTMFRNTLAYNLGRVMSYTIIGAVLGLIGGLAGLGTDMQTSSLVQGMIKLIAGIFMVVMGINMLGIFPRLRKFRIQIPVFRGILGKSRTPFIIGLCNGLMPCGPLQAMQIVALASGSAVSGAFSMFCFSLGTVPLMLGFGSLVSALGKRFTRQVLKVGAVLVVVMGLSMVSQGITLSGMNGRTSVEVTDKGENQNTDTDVEDNGVQYISSRLEYGYYPNIKVKVGIPVEWKIQADGNSINGCNYKIIQKDLGIEYAFEEGENQIQFIPEKEGVYTYSCWMGMITGKIYVEK